jgi:hypothetical protein
MMDEIRRRKLKLMFLEEWLKEQEMEISELEPSDQIWVLQTLEGWARDMRLRLERKASDRAERSVH